MPNPTTQAEVDALRILLFAALEANNTATASVQAASATRTQKALAWQNALGALVALPANTPAVTIASAEALVTSTEAEYVAAAVAYVAAQQAAAGAPAALESARQAYATAVNHLVNGT